MKWYYEDFNNIHDQSLIIDEDTGASIAVAYDKKNAPILAAAPDLLEALEELVAQEDWEGEEVNPMSPVGKAFAVIARAREKTVKEIRERIKE
jgi:hypothetical protein